MTHEIFTTPQNRQIAFHRSTGSGPGIVFFGGFKSDMDGTKAVYLEEWARSNDRAFLRFDYSGHGKSSGAFLDGSIGDWFADAAAAITALTDGPQIIVGSSMGGWIALLVARAMPERVAGLVGIAAAPDFTEDSMWAGFDEAQRRELQQTGHVSLPSDYSDEPYVITRRLIEDGRENLVLRDPLPLRFPVRLLHGTEDTDVAMSVPLRLLAHADAPDMQLTLIRGADHRLSSDENLAQIVETIDDIS